MQANCRAKVSWEEYYAVFNAQIYKITPYYTMN